jgi:CheY-like chemotaxis protein
MPPESVEGGSGLGRRTLRPRCPGLEDEPLMLMDAQDLVTDAGFEAIRAKNADEAIRILENRKDIRVVFTDVNMPGSMDGIKLAMRCATVGRRLRSS